MIKYFLTFYLWFSMWCMNIIITLEKGKLLCFFRQYPVKRDDVFLNMYPFKI